MNKSTLLNIDEQLARDLAAAGLDLDYGDSSDEEAPGKIRQISKNSEYSGDSSEFIETEEKAMYEAIVASLIEHTGA